MSREVVLYCTDGGQHERHDVKTWRFTDDLKPGERAPGWSLATRNDTLTLKCGHCTVVQGVEVKCRQVYRLGRRSNKLLGELEREARISGRAEHDLSESTVVR